jgi:hypothetical protein
MTQCCAPSAAPSPPRPGAIILLIAKAAPRPRLTLDRHVYIDTMASGGDVALLSAEA